MIDFSIIVEPMDNKQNLIVSIHEMNISNICLLCLESNDNLVEISGKEGIDLNIATILQQHFWFEVNSDFFRLL